MCGRSCEAGVFSVMVVVMMINRAFLRGVTYKAAGLGTASVVASSLIWSWSIGLSLTVGVSLAIANLLSMSWIMGKILRGPAAQKQSTLGWGMLFLLKLLVLFGVTYYVIAVARLNPLGFAAGYALLLVAIVWQALVPAQSKPE